MAELDHNILRKHISSLMESNNLTQEELGNIAGMTQSSVSKVLSGTSCFSLDQVFRISQHFHIPIDQLVGNKVGFDASYSPSSILNHIIKLLTAGKMRTIQVTIPETVYSREIVDGKYENKTYEQANIQYTAFYFPSFYSVDDFAFNEDAKEDLHCKFLTNGNGTPYYLLNQKLTMVLPLIPLKRSGIVQEKIINDALKNHVEELAKQESQLPQE